MSNYIIWAIQILIIPALSPLFIGVIRKIKAIFQNRVGASIFQPYKDVWKLFNKDEVITKDASWIFRFAPYIIFTATLLVGASIPIFTSAVVNNFTSDILAVIYILAIGTFFIALAGIDTGGAFGGFGSSREMTLAALSEGGFLFSLLAISFINKTTNLFTISANVPSIFDASFLPIVLAFLGFFIIILAENARFPFDNPSTHLELTMVHEAMILEYSGKRLALIEWAAANKLLIFMALGANLFFPWGIANSLGFQDIAMSLIFFAGKILTFCLAIAVIESSIAKLRLFRLPDLLLFSFILSAIAIGLII